ncbi:hypothetical protein IG631_21193 [Alternaria alternata]|nr:hypothetical protein IG631_21193 [Alternaria alternata]
MAIFRDAKCCNQVAAQVRNVYLGTFTELLALSNLLTRTANLRGTTMSSRLWHSTRRNTREVFLLPTPLLFAHTNCAIQCHMFVSTGAPFHRGKLKLPVQARVLAASRRNFVRRCWP